VRARSRTPLSCHIARASRARTLRARHHTCLRQHRATGWAASRCTRRAHSVRRAAHKSRTSMAGRGIFYTGAAHQNARRAAYTGGASTAFWRGNASGDVAASSAAALNKAGEENGQPVVAGISTSGVMTIKAIRRQKSRRRKAAKWWQAPATGGSDQRIWRVARKI